MLSSEQHPVMCTRKLRSRHFPVHVTGYYPGHKMSFHIDEESESYGEDTVATELDRPVEDGDCDYSDDSINDDNPLWFLILTLHKNKGHMFQMLQRRKSLPVQVPAPDIALVRGLPSFISTPRTRSLEPEDGNGDGMDIPSTFRIVISSNMIPFVSVLFCYRKLH